eukprot:Nitzschia sp. Nitz4//scaffold347_size17400//14860//15669//NITZ4_008838-RA/size17400-processed-gene-0.7-mRNA-1//1//CDS//3329548675//4462//frame0
MSSKPIVVLAGWLGSQHRHLTKYTQLYQAMGMDVLPVISTPTSVIQCTRESSSISIPANWPQSQHKPETMQGLAWQILSDLQVRQPPAILFHAFSNGGCFVWEQVRKILDMNPPVHDALPNLSSQLRGVVFDSCPAHFAQHKNFVHVVVELCPPDDQKQILETIGSDVIYNESDNDRKTRQRRWNEYFGYLQQDPLTIPQLYIYSQDDYVCEFGKVHELVQYRKENSQAPILEFCPKPSQHCAHLMHHPEDYANAIRDLTHLALKMSKI